MDTTLEATFHDQALRHLDPLYATALRLTRRSVEAEDLVQETVLRAYAAFERFEPGTNCRAWIFRILMNTFINGYRRRRRERLLFDTSRDASVLEQVTRAPGHGDVADLALDDEVARALDELPEEYRSVVLLVDVGDLSYREVAHVLGCPLGTVMSRLHRARRALQRKLASYAEREGYVRALAVA
jgi:RNA polymerase sigma-70 factor, ECF subfamily